MASSRAGVLSSYVYLKFCCDIPCAFTRGECTCEFHPALSATIKDVPRCLSVTLSLQAGRVCGFVDFVGDFDWEDDVDDLLRDAAATAGFGEFEA